MPSPKSYVSGMPYDPRFASVRGTMLNVEITQFVLTFINIDRTIRDINVPYMCSYRYVPFSSDILVTKCTCAGICKVTLLYNNILSGNFHTKSVVSQLID